MGIDGGRADVVDPGIALLLSSLFEMSRVATLCGALHKKQHFVALLLLSVSGFPGFVHVFGGTAVPSIIHTYTICGMSQQSIGSTLLKSSDIPDVLKIHHVRSHRIIINGQICHLEPVLDCKH